MTAKSVNEVPLKVNNLVQLVGAEPRDPVVGYVKAMFSLLNNKKSYKIKKISKSRTGRWVIRVNDWNWDTRNIYKKKIENTPKPKPVLFDLNLLDV